MENMYDKIKYMNSTGKYFCQAVIDTENSDTTITEEMFLRIENISFIVKQVLDSCIYGST